MGNQIDKGGSGLVVDRNRGIDTAGVRRVYQQMHDLAKLAEEKGLVFPSRGLNGQENGGKMCCLQDEKQIKNGYRIEYITKQENRSVIEQNGKVLDDYTWIQDNVTFVLYEDSAPALTVRFTHKDDDLAGSEPTLVITIRPDMWEKYMPGTMSPQNVRSAGFGQIYLSDRQSLTQADPAIFTFTEKVVQDFGKHFDVA